MRFRNIFIILSLVLVASCSGRGRFSAELEDAIYELDKTIGDEAVIEMSKTDRIAKLKSGLSHQGSPEEMYWTMNEIFNEYFQYDVDSAIFYAHRKLDIAKQISSQGDLRRGTSPGMRSIHDGSITLWSISITMNGLGLIMRRFVNKSIQNLMVQFTH